MDTSNAKQETKPLVETGEGTKPTKPISKKLIRPFAVISFFYNAARTALDELTECLTQWETKMDRATAQNLYASFGILARAIKIHSDHEMEGLYPEIKCFLENQSTKRRKKRTLDALQLKEALSNLSKFTMNHRKNIQLIGRNANYIAAFVKKVEQNRYIEMDKDLDVQELYDTASESLTSWIVFYHQFLIDEEMFISPLLPHLGRNKINEIKIAKGIVELNRDEIVQYQIGFTISKVINYTANKQWECPRSTEEGFEYTTNEVLAAYIRCFQMVSTVDEYQEILNIIPKYVDPEVWKDLKSYGLGEPGLFRYTSSPSHWNVAETCVEKSCGDLNGSICTVL